MTLKSVLSGLDIRYKKSDGKKVPVVNGVASLADASRHDLSFCSSNGEYGAYLISKSNAGVILCKKSVQDFISVYGYFREKVWFMYFSGDSYRLLVFHLSFLLAHHLILVLQQNAFRQA